MKEFLHGTRQAVSVTVVLMLICGLLFPCLLTGLSSVLFPHQAGGSLISVNGTAVGAEHVGQEFTQDCYMWSRPSAYHYNVYTESEDGRKYYNDGTEFGGLASGSNNYAPSNPALVERVEADMEAFLAKNPDVEREDIPTDLLTASGSGLDPHISPESAQIQLPRIAQASGLSEESLQEIVNRNTTGKLLGVFGEETVNVLKVNIEIAQAMGTL
ncbi:potassium-transporting ATPase subunit KdpC [Allofournierella sp. CML151]|uniref:potassium-transporting ATPase subunit KdpC n=1 Tax=Allofournierella sp. CML151 TaxID=2998082 RepID=UPI0022EAE33B|nr:potassium-transporting ATPase subunit KdpC [Fournierella sp. CML151]